MTKEYTFQADIWLYPGKAAWHFITLPIEVAQDIDYFFSMQKKGWGSLRSEVTVGKTTWETSIFPDKKSNSYLLPLKAEVRRKEQIKEGDEISVLLKIST